MYSRFKNYIYEDVERGVFGKMLESNHREALKKCGELVIDALLFADKIHVWHLTCDTDKQHITFNDIYDLTREFADGLAEILLGEGESIAIHNKTTEFCPFTSEEKCYKEIKDFVDGLGDIATNPLDYSISISDIVKKYIVDVTSKLGVATFK